MKLTLQIDTVASSGDQGKLTYYMYLAWHPLEAALSILTFCLLFIRRSRSVDLRKHWQVIFKVYWH